MRRTLVSTLLGLAATPLFAQSPAGAPAPSVYQASITVTATAEPEPADEVPATVTVISAEEIAARQAVDALPLLASVAGVATTRGGSAGKVASQFTRGTNSNQTLFLWNGVTLNDPYLGGFDLSTLSTDGVERIEVARGPFSALYGSSAVGGVVQLLTRRHGSELAARAEAGSHELLRAGVSGAGEAGPLHLMVAGHLRRGEGEVDNDFWDGDEIVASLDAGGERGWRGGALVRAIDSEIGIPYDFTGAPTPQRRQNADALSIALPFGWNDASWQLEGQAAHTETDLEVGDPTDPFAESRAEARRDQGRLQLRRQGEAGWRLTVGGEWERASVDSSSAFGDALAGESERIWAAFAQGSWSRGPARVDLGVRRDEHDAFGGETSVRAAAACALGERVRVRAAYGESFRAPSLADLYYPGFSNPDLRPERGESEEIAVEANAGPLRATLALFRNDLDGLIEFDFTTFQPQNLGRARAQGVEATLEYRRGSWQARLDATHLDAEDRSTGEPLLRRPEESANLLLLVRPGVWTLGATVRYVGSRTDFGDVPLDAYETLDLTAARRIGERFEPFVRIDNATDERYEEAAGFPAPRRGFAAGCAVRF